MARRDRGDLGLKMQKRNEGRFEFGGKFETKTLNRLKRSRKGGMGGVPDDRTTSTLGGDGLGWCKVGGRRMLVKVSEDETKNFT